MAEASLSSTLPAAAQAEFEALAGAPLSVPQAREHWKYSKLSSALALIGRHTSAATLDAPPEAALAAMARDAAFCPAASQLMTEAKGVHHQVLQDSCSLPSRDATTPLVLEVPEGASTQVSDAEIGPSSAWVVIIVRAGARLSLFRERTQDSEEWHKLQIVLERDASASLQVFDRGSSFRRHDVSVDLMGSGASMEFSGAALASAKEHLDLQYAVRHHAPHTQSNLKWHAIGQDSAKLTFRGRIWIDEHCSGVNAQLNNRNLALGDGVSINTKPELEIYSDDVRCAHGATVGQLDEQALFYLRSRGIAPTIARRMLAEGFLRECATGDQAEQAAAQLAGALT